MIGLSPVASGAVHVTRTDCEAGWAVTPPGVEGATGPLGVTALLCAETGPAPLGLSAWTLKRYVVPVVSPVTVAGQVCFGLLGDASVVPTLVGFVRQAPASAARADDDDDIETVELSSTDDELSQEIQ